MEKQETLIISQKNVVRLDFKLIITLKVLTVDPDCDTQIWIKHIIWDSIYSADQQIYT